ncbi:MAG: hypothetical protein IH845_01505 [Nanoarchaeota archaeon]|nr:hypothetical protein [Nanoarchaeota archaeon]
MSEENIVYVAWVTGEDGLVRSLFEENLSDISEDVGPMEQHFPGIVAYEMPKKTYEIAMRHYDSGSRLRIQEGSLYLIDEGGRVSETLKLS